MVNSEIHHKKSVATFLWPAIRTGTSADYILCTHLSCDLHFRPFVYYLRHSCSDYVDLHVYLEEEVINLIRRLREATWGIRLYYRINHNFPPWTSGHDFGWVAVERIMKNVLWFIGIKLYTILLTYTLSYGLTGISSLTNFYLD